MRDIVLAMKTWMQSREAIASEVGDAQNGYEIFREEMPLKQTEKRELPDRKSIVIRRVPGPPASTTLQLERGNLDIAIFAPTPKEAAELAQIVSQELKDLERAFVEIPDNGGTTLIHWCKQLGSPASYRDGDTNWPFTLLQHQFLASEVEVT